MEAVYFTVALLLVVAGATVVVVGGTLAGLWAAGAARADPVVGGIGVALTTVAAVNLFVARRCGTADLPDGTTIDTVNRPIVAVFAEQGDCFRTSLGQVALVAVLGVATSVLIRLRGRGRDRPTVTVR